MNFFQHQDDARRRTVRLLVLFVLAIVALTLLTMLCTAFFAPWILGSHGMPNNALNDAVMEGHVLSDSYLQAAALLVPAIILSASAYKLWQLSDGGETVATLMGGRPLNTPQTQKEQQLLNIVEEMAIASGMSVPPVYILEDEPGINAFTAGYRTHDMVIGVTRGCLKVLTREELQGVIAHEFSHILNGDTRLNTRMIGILYGISMISLIGQQMIGLSIWADTSRDIERIRSGSLVDKEQEQDESENAGIAGGFIIWIFAVCLIAIGALGGFFATMIKAAICREREFLADASAVQFTRNPDGIAGALKKIGGYSWHSDILFSGSAIVEHMLFSFDRNPKYEFATLATHPSLEERIRRIDPRWDGQLPQFSRFDQAMMEDETDQRPYDAIKTAQVLGTLAAAPVVFNAAMQKQAADTDNLGYARDVLLTLPEEWLSCARQKQLAICVILALLLHQDMNIAKRQLERIGRGSRLWAAQTEKLLASRLDISICHRLPLIEIALPRIAAAINEVKPYEALKVLLKDIIRMDQQVSLFEWCAYAIVTAYLKPLCEKTTPSIIPTHTPRIELAHEICLLLSLVSRYSNHGQNAEAAFQAACRAGNLDIPHPPYENNSRLADLPKTLRKLSHLAPLEKPSLIHAMVAIIRYDGNIDPTERELLRATCLTLGCPMPPLG